LAFPKNVRSLLKKVLFFELQTEDLNQL